MTSSREPLTKDYFDGWKDALLWLTDEFTAWHYMSHYLKEDCPHDKFLDDVLRDMDKRVREMEQLYGE